MRGALVAVTLVAAVGSGGGLPRTFFGVEPVPPGDDVALAMDLAAALGVGRVGVNAVTWEAVEPAPGVYDWSALDALALAADARGLELQLTFQVASSWGTESVGGSAGALGSSPPRPEHRAELLRTLAALARRLGGPPGARLPGLSRPVLAQLMVGNEIEVPAHWTANGSPDNPATPETYFALLAEIADAVHAAAPGVEVMRGSANLLCVFDDGPGEDEVERRLAALEGATGGYLHEWLELSFAAQPPFDVFSNHPNFAPDGVEHQAVWLRPRLAPGVALVAEDMRSTLVDPPELPGVCAASPRVWPDLDADGVPDVLETLAAGPSDPGYEAARQAFQAAQARVTVRKVTLAAVAGYEGVFVSTLFDFGTAYPIPEWWFTGLVDRATLAPRPAFHAYREAISALAGAEPAGLERRADGAVLAWFRRGGRRFAVAWSDAGAAVVDLSRALPGLVTLRRFPALPGETGMVEVPVEAAAVPLGPTPVLLEPEPRAPRRPAGRDRPGPSPPRGPAEAAAGR